MNNLSNKLYKALNSPIFTQSRPVNAHHPSSASIRINGPLGPIVIGECNRKLWYQNFDTGHSDYGETEWQLSAKMGDKFHELAIDLIQQYGYKMGLQLVSIEQSFYDPKHNVSGRTDIVAWDIAEQQPIGIEVKSVGEYKAKMTIEKPADEHILQAMIYLDWYDRFTAPSSPKITKWYIWYLARSESWALKGKEHGSPFSQMWDFYITLDNGSPVIHTAKGSVKLPEFNVSKIYQRYQELDKAKLANTIPERDYQIQFSEERLATMYKLDLIEYKKDKEPIEKWLKKGAKPGTLNLEMGDFNCKLCPYKTMCWSGIEPDSKNAHYVEFAKTTKLPPKEEDSLFL